MARKLSICTAVAALALAAPAWAASPLDEYQQTGHITPCRYSSDQLHGSVPNDVAQYAPEYASQLQAAARERASGCGGSGAATGRGAAAGGAGSSSASSGAGPGTVTGATTATARKVRARVRARRQARARARLAAATVPPGDISTDARVPDRALLLAALPILLLLGLAAAPRTWEAVGRRARLARGPARTPSGAIILPPAPAGMVDGNGNGSGNGAAEAAAAEAPTEEAAALYPPATSRRRKTRYAAKSDGTA